MDDIFKALADPSRRMLLDLLYEKDGRTLNELCAHLQMSRFGVMKHLRILEEAGLLTTRKAGREKYHYLNPAAIRRIHDRWVSKYAEPWVAGLSRLKQDLERETEMERKPRHVQRIAIRTSPEQVWNALTDPEKTSQYWYNGALRGEVRAGAPYEILNPKGKPQARGEFLAVEPPRRLVMTWQLLELAETAEEKPSRLTWEIEERADFPGVTLVTVVHDEFEEAPNTARVLEEGLSIVLSGMKTLIETGRPLTS